jgi:hypothetical protein
MRIRAAALLLGVAAVTAAVPAAGAEHPLFDGKTLDGWSGDARLWSVRDGVIVGSTEGAKLTHNEFLISNREYGDFVLHAEMKLRNHNSGIQFRSEALPEYVVRGYQADAGENNYWGNIYEEKGTRGTMVDGWAAGGKDVVHLKDWNTYEIRCQGDHITVTLNGKVTADIHDSSRLRGVIALQLHAGPAMEAYFRNIRIEELD